MDLKDVAAVSGKSGLFKVLKPTKTGVILETIDENKKRLMANANSRVSILKEISIYTTSEDGSLLLEDVFQTIDKKFGKKLPVEPKSSEDELRDFISTVIPDYDKDKVYHSDLKKLVVWYNLLYQYMPELFDKKEEEKEDKKEVDTKTSKAKSKDSAPAKKASTTKKAPSKTKAEQKTTTAKSESKSSTTKKTATTKSSSETKAKKKD